MAVESGITATLTVDESSSDARDISADVNNVQMNVSRGELNITGITTAAMVRLTGLADFQGTVNGYFDDATSLAFEVYEDAGSTAVARTFLFALSGQSLSVETFISTVNWSRTNDGGMGFSAQHVLQNGTEPVWS